MSYETVDSDAQRCATEAGLHAADAQKAICKAVGATNDGAFRHLLREAEYYLREALGEVMEARRAYP